MPLHASRVVIGTSSWADPGFVEEWYPSDLPARERLRWYAQRFEAVEVNTTFYAVPSRATAAGWVEATPEGFTFDIKLHRLLSRHAAKPDSLPKDPRGVAPTTERGPVRLDDRLEAAGWTHEDRREATLGGWRSTEAALVCLDGPQGGAPTLPELLDAATCDEIAYFRAHGRNLEGYLCGRTVAERFGWHYSHEELKEIRGRLEGLAREVPTVRMMLNNNRGSDAPVAAQRMRELMGQAVP